MAVAMVVMWESYLVDWKAVWLDERWVELSVEMTVDLWAHR